MTTQIDDIDALFPSRYLKASDFPAPRVLTMSGITQERMVDGELKAALLFTNAPDNKPLILNTVNKNVIVKLYGRRPSAWVGREVEAYATETPFRGEMVPCVRLKAPPAQPVQFAPVGQPSAPVQFAAPPAHVLAVPGEPEVVDDPDAEIPF